MIRSPRDPRSILLALAAVLALAASLLAGGASPTVGATSAEDPARGAAPDGHVIAISLDGFNPTALARLGRRATPHLHRIIANGTTTLNARTQVEQTVTLPNHTSMLTGRRIDAAEGGHGVDWNTDVSPLGYTTVQEAAGEDVGSVFTVVSAAGGSTALFSTKDKFDIFQDSWPGAVDKEFIRDGNDAAVVRAARNDLATNQRAFTFIHLGLGDKTGHAKGWMSKPYLTAVRTLDGLVGQIMRTMTTTPGLDDAVLVLTADHGGVPGTKSHTKAGNYQNYRIPFMIWGDGVRKGDLYKVNQTTRRDPGRSRPHFAGRQPVRNGEVANLATDLLGLDAVPGSIWNAAQNLRWARAR